MSEQASLGRGPRFLCVPASDRLIVMSVVQCMTQLCVCCSCGMMFCQNFFEMY